MKQMHSKNPIIKETCQSPNLKFNIDKEKTNPQYSVALNFSNHFSYFFESKDPQQEHFSFFWKLAPFSFLSKNKSTSIQTIACRSYFSYSNHQYHHLTLNTCLEKMMFCFGKNFSYYKHSGSK